MCSNNVKGPWWLLRPLWMFWAVQPHTVFVPPCSLSAGEWRQEVRLRRTRRLPASLIFIIIVTVLNKQPAAPLPTMWCHWRRRAVIGLKNISSDCRPSVKLSSKLTKTFCFCLFWDIKFDRIIPWVQLQSFIPKPEGQRLLRHMKLKCCTNQG